MTPSYKNSIRESIESGAFLYTLEHVPELLTRKEQGLQELAREAKGVARDDRVRGVNIGDRVKSMDSCSTVMCGRVAAEASGKMPLLHLAGKDRTPEEAAKVFTQAHSYGLNTFLIVSGDRILEKTRPGRPRYNDSIIGIKQARELVRDAFIAAAVSPFKYREEELLNQYLKFVKKINAGADYVITNVGWDMRKFQELIWYRNARNLDTPIVANLLLPRPGWAKAINAGRLPGVHMSDDLYKKMSEELQQGVWEEASFNRLALSILRVKRMGYAGVQLSGVDTYEQLTSVIDRVDYLETKLISNDDLIAAWDEAHRLGDGRMVDFAPSDPIYLFGEDEAPQPGSLNGPPVLDGANASSPERRKYHAMHFIHEHAFKKKSIGAKVLAPLMRAIDSTTLGRRWLFKLEHAVKKSTLGCDACGFCRIQYLAYTCPETCPKGLANGPCAGTDENVCEFKDRECIHNRKYRIAKSVGRLKDLETVYVPPVPTATRGTSSWVNEYTDRVPRVETFGDQTIVTGNGRDRQPQQSREKEAQSNSYSAAR
ncbi:methylenetetrahydrofolate reductase C-terminal domain-containing protein [Ectothiorhodospiraceae bacterium WFHF3C12]|nr:methylenetetrahydrofolate reductase C-terminal domain-containing protein [Ectothiorhodospiraceae bacterium WFHF3C12]